MTTIREKMLEAALKAAIDELERLGYFRSTKVIRKGKKALLLK